MLLNLPTELLAQVLRQLEPDEFYVFLFVCKVTRSTALTSKSVLLAQLHALPGIKEGLEDLSTERLAVEYRKRATQNLCGMNVFADVAKFAPRFTNIKIKECVFLQRCHPRLAVVLRDEPAVRLYTLFEDHFRFEAELRPEDCNPHTGGAEMDVVKVAFSEDEDVAVLYQYKLPATTDDEIKNSSFVEEARRQSINTLQLVCYKKLAANHRPRLWSSYIHETRDIKRSRDPGSVPISLALSKDGTAAISWRLLKPTETELTTACLYNRRKYTMDTYGYDPSPRETIFTRSPVPPRDREFISGMQFLTDRQQILLYTPDCPIHSSYANVISGDSFDGTTLRNFEPVQLLNYGNETFASEADLKIGMPFHGAHEVFVDDAGADQCRKSWLALAIYSGDQDHGASAWIVLGIEELAHQFCDHLLSTDLGRRRADTWTPVCRLDGFEQGSSSVGTVMVLSQNNKHIAMASWRRLLIWTIEPPELDSGREPLENGRQYSYFSNRGASANGSASHISPVELPNSAVIHKLAFVGEDTLYAITDKGLVRWNIGPEAKASREFCGLDVASLPSYDEGSSPSSPPPDPKSIVFDLYNDEIGPVHVDMSASAPISPPHREVDKSVATKNTDRGIVDNQSAKLESYVINTLDLTSCSARSAHQNLTRPPKKWNKVLWWKKLNPDTQTTEEKGVMVELEALGRRSRWTRYKRKMNITKILENHKPPPRYSKE